MRRPTFLAAILLALLVPVTGGAQGGNAAYNSLRLATPLAREYMEPQGAQDSAYDLLTADTTVMSSTYVTVMSGTVTTGEADDAVAVHVTGQFGVMVSLYVVDDTGRELWRISDPTAPGGAISSGAFPAGLTEPNGITSHGGSLYVVDRQRRRVMANQRPFGTGRGNLAGAFPSGIGTPTGITSHGGSLYVVDPTRRRVMANQRCFGTGRGNPRGRVPIRATLLPNGITSHGGSLYVVDVRRRRAMA